MAFILFYNFKVIFKKTVMQLSFLKYVNRKNIFEKFLNKALEVILLAFFYLTRELSKVKFFRFQSDVKLFVNSLNSDQNVLSYDYEK